MILCNGGRKYNHQVLFRHKANETMIRFTKMHGAGNDFALIDNSDGTLVLEPQQITRLCHRQFGVGADGIILAERDGCGRRMRYFNRDGSEGEMCGNGARCFARFIRERVVKTNDSFLSFGTLSGTVKARFESGRDDEVSVSLCDPFDMSLGEQIDVAGTLMEVNNMRYTGSIDEHDRDLLRSTPSTPVFPMP